MTTVNNLSGNDFEDADNVCTANLDSKEHESLVRLFTYIYISFFANIFNYSRNIWSKIKSRVQEGQITTLVKLNL